MKSRLSNGPPVYLVLNATKFLLKKELYHRISKHLLHHLNNLDPYERRSLTEAHRL